MAQTTYQVILSTDGKHTVIVNSDNPAEIKTAGAWAKAAYDAIVDRYGLKGAVKPTAGHQEQTARDVPTCELHGVPMELVNGRKGPLLVVPRKEPGWQLVLL